MNDSFILNAGDEYRYDFKEAVMSPIFEKFAREYRLGSRGGELILQGNFYWFDFDGEHSEWRDIPTVFLDEPKKFM